MTCTCILLVQPSSRTGCDQYHAAGALARGGCRDSRDKHNRPRWDSQSNALITIGHYDLTQRSIGSHARPKFYHDRWKGWHWSIQILQSWSHVYRYQTTLFVELGYVDNGCDGRRTVATFYKSGFWDKVPEESILNFGDAWIFLEHSAG